MSKDKKAAKDLFSIAGEMGEDLRAIDWSATPLGPVQDWPRSLKNYLTMIWELPSAAVIFWGDDFIQFYNQAYADMMGPDRHPRFLGARAEDCWTDTYPVLYPWMIQVVSHEETQTFDNTLLTLTRYGFKEEAYFSFTFSPLRDDAGEVRGILQPVFDVTQAVLAERRSEVLRTLARYDLDTLIRAERAFATNAFDIPFSLIYLRSEAKACLELAETSGFEDPFFSEQDLEPFLGVAERMCATREPGLIDEVDSLLPRPHLGPWHEPTRAAFAVPLRCMPGHQCDGVVIFGLSPRLHFDASYRGFLEEAARALVVSLDAERAQRVEAQLIKREREARMEAEFQREDLVRLLSEAPAPMAILRGEDLVIELANDSICEAWSRSWGELINRPILEALPEVRGTEFDEMLREVLETGEACVGMERRAELGRTERLETSYFNFVYSPLHRPDGVVDGVLVTAFDVTEQVRARQKMDGLRREAEAANRTKDEFLAMLGHELRNPLAPIITALELMDLKGGEHFRRERDIIARQSEHMVTLIDDLLDISRITRGKVELRCARINVADVIEHALEMTRPLINAREHQLVMRVDNRPLMVFADPARLAQVISNLLTNAAKYTPPGGTITVSAESKADQIEVSVRDTGVGIEAEVLSQVFEAFTQESQSLDRSAGGLGLGLAIVRNLVTLQGGSVEAKSDGRGEGSEFIVQLPVFKESDTLADSASAS